MFIIWCYVHTDIDKKLCQFVCHFLWLHLVTVSEVNRFVIMKAGLYRPYALPVAISLKGNRFADLHVPFPVERDSALLTLALGHLWHFCYEQNRNGMETGCVIDLWTVLARCGSATH